MGLAQAKLIPFELTSNLHRDASRITNTKIVANSSVDLIRNVLDNKKRRNGNFDQRDHNGHHFQNYLTHYLRLSDSVIELSCLSFSKTLFTIDGSSIFLPQCFQ